VRISHRSHRAVFLGASLLLFALAAPGRAQYSLAAPHRGIGVSVWRQDLSGELGGTDAGFQGQATLAEQGDSSFGLQANLGRWELGFTSLSHRTTAQVQATFRYDGQVYNAGDSLRLKHEVNMFDAFRRFPLSTSDSSSVFALAGVKVLGFESRVRGTQNQAEASLDETVPVPMLGLAFRAGPRDGVHLFGGVRAIRLGVGDVDAGMFDASLGLAYQPGDALRLALGYRDYSLDVEVRGGSDSGRLDLGNDGLFFEAGLRF